MGRLSPVMQRGIVLGALPVDSVAAGGEEGGNVQETLLTGDHEADVTVAIDELQVCSSFHRGAHNLHVSVKGGRRQRVLLGASRRVKPGTMLPLFLSFGTCFLPPRIKRH